MKRIFSYIAQSNRKGEKRVYFTNGDHQAFESLMQGKPGADHYDSGIDGPLPECRSCRFHQPKRRDRFCRFAECPYFPGHMTAISKGNPPQKGGDSAL